MTAAAERAHRCGRRPRRRAAEGHRRSAVPVRRHLPGHGARRAGPQHGRRRAGSSTSTPARASAARRAVGDHPPNAPRLGRGPAGRARPAAAPALQDDRILHHGQYVAMVVADTPEEAADAARCRGRLRAAEPRARRRRRARRAAPIRAASTAPRRRRRRARRGRCRPRRASTRPPRTPTTRSGCSRPSRRWDGDRLVRPRLHAVAPRTCTTLARGVRPAGGGGARPRAYLGGGFGAGLRVWPHVILTALAAASLGRPVKLVLTRPQMFTGVGHRPRPCSGCGSAPRRRRADGYRPRGACSGRDGGRQPRAGRAVTAASYACPNVVHPRPAAPAQHPVPQLDARARARPRAASRSSRRSTSSPTRSASTRSSCGCATTPTSTRRSGFRGRARPCASATRWAPNGSAGRSATPRAALDARRRLAVGSGMAGVTSRGARPVRGPRDDRRRRHRRACAAPPPTSAPAPTR